jgi:FHS family L-fucose permease-like MFS transporter
MSRPTATPRVALTVATTIFFMWGFLTVLNDVLIPHLKTMFTLNYAQAMLVQFVFFGAYFVMSLPSGKVLARVGYPAAITIGLVVTGIGALLFVPAAMLASYGFFLGALFVLASGITLLQVAANPYVSLMGDPKFSSSRLTLAQALNSLGTTLGPWFGGMVILSGAVLGTEQLAQLAAPELAAYRAEQASLVTVPYVGLAIALFVLAVIVWLFRLPKLSEATEAGDSSHHRIADVLRFRHVRNGVAAIFLYVGAEVAIGSFMINYLSMKEIGGISEASASTYLSLYWGGAMIGRFIGAALMRFFNPRHLLGLSAISTVLLLAITMLTTGQVAFWSVLAIGLFNSIMFPTIFTLGIEKMGALTDKASSVLIMAIVGGAIVPVLQGLLADRIGVQMAFIVPLLCYLFIVYYGFIGSRVEPGAAVPGDVLPGAVIPRH